MQNQNSNENDSSHAAAELLAFALYAVEFESTGTDDAIRDVWQSSPEVRIQYRKRSADLTARLRESGWRFRQGDAKQLGKTLSWLLTVPPRTAYDLQEESNSSCLPPET